MSTMSDHCPVRTVLSVRILRNNLQDDYDYIESPRKLPWSTDIAVRFENILQTPEYVLRVENLIQNHSIRCQEVVDLVTEKQIF